jgi:hypothetical protein
MFAFMLLLEILGIASTSAQAFLKGDASAGNNVAQALITIVQKAMLAYQAQTGKPIDPTLLRPFEPLP